MDRAVTSPNIAAAIFAGMVAMSVANLLPLMVGVLADRMALSSSQAGLVAAADLAGLAVGSASCVLLRGFSLRAIGVSGLSLLVLANLGSTVVHSFAALATIRFFGGLGGGAALAICYAVLAVGDQARDFGIFNIGQIGIGWLGMIFATPVLAALGWQGLFMVLALLAGSATVLSAWLPRHVVHPGDAAASDSGSGARRSSLPAALAVVSVLIYFSGLGGIWAYLDRIGASAGVSPEAVNRGLIWCTAGGMLASGFATWIDSRFGLILPLVTGYAIAITGLYLLGSTGTGEAYLVAACTFVFGWNVIVPYQFATVARVDTDGRYAMLASTVSVSGLAIGPALAALFPTDGAYFAARAFAFALCVASAGLLLPALRTQPAAV